MVYYRIPVYGGPESFGGLPGMILELNFDQSGIIYSALEISEKTDRSIVKAPEEGKKFSSAEFTDRFGGLGNGQPVIRIIRDCYIWT
jgi:GLPGLI family protein